MPLILRRASRPRSGSELRIALTLLAALALACAGRPSARDAAERPFAALVESLSEPGGYFDTDNLITNERSYLHVLPVLERHGVRGGAYIGVGPDQNFSYVARVRPEIAFVVDIRRDNLLLHLAFKAMFERADTRIEYLSLLFGRPSPPDPEAWVERPVEELAAYIDATPPDPSGVEEIRRLVDATIDGFGLTLSEAERRTIDRFHRQFIEAGLSLRFTSFGRRPRFFYPDYRELLLERDRLGRPGHYLAAEEDYRFLKRLQDSDRVIPVVGDLAGAHAVRAIGGEVAGRGLTVSAFYTSNVEFYLVRSGSFAAYVDNLRSLPRDERSVLIRSVFHSTFGPHPDAVPGYSSTQLVQSLTELLSAWADGRYRSYRELVTRDVLR